MLGRGETNGMSRRETFWMACDSTEELRAEYGPFRTRTEAESEARRLGFGFLLRYEQLIGEKEEVQQVRCVFLQLSETHTDAGGRRTLHTRCATCGESAVHELELQAEVWADIHEFEHMRHRVRLFEHSKSTGLKEIGDWRNCA